MPFSFGGSINHIADAILRAPIVATVVQSPIWTALVLTFVIILIVMIIFRDVEMVESPVLLAGRSGFWIFLLLLGALFLHNKVLIRDDADAKSTNIYDAVHGAGNVDGYTEDFEVPIVPVLSTSAMP